MRHRGLRIPTIYLESVNQENKKLVEERRRPDETAATATIVSPC